MSDWTVAALHLAAALIALVIGWWYARQERRRMQRMQAELDSWVSMVEHVQHGAGQERAP